MFRTLLSRISSEFKERFHWQNLHKADGHGDAPLHGRAWFRFGDRTALRFEWNLLADFVHAHFALSDEAEVQASVALKPIAIWLTFESWPLLGKLTQQTGDREVGISVHDGCVWWKLGVDPNTWSSEDPVWMQGSWSYVDALFGKARVERKDIGKPERVTIPMPEGLYEGSCTMTLVRVGRPRWFSTMHRTAQIELDRPLPIPGKGENSWDCDEDAIYSQSGPARSPAEAVAHLVESALTTRERHGGKDWRPAQPTAQPAAQA
jgi:hypothetical protein